MPALKEMGQHAALTQGHATLRPGEMLSGYLDDIYVFCDPSRVAEIFLQVKQLLFRSGGIKNFGKTKIWNSAAEAWTGEGPEEDRGLVVFGLPVGHRAFVQKWLADKEQSHAQFLSRIPAVQDAQSAWLLLLMCAGPRAHHILRNLPPSEVSQFCQNHDNRLRECLPNILAVEVPDGVASEVVQLPFREGRQGLRSAARLAPAACWPSWADCLSQVYAGALAISRISCSRLPFCNQRALATVVHRPPSFAGITTRSLCFAPLQPSAHMSRDHIFG